MSSTQSLHLQQGWAAVENTGSNLVNQQLLSFYWWKKLFLLTEKVLCELCRAYLLIIQPKSGLLIALFYYSDWCTMYAALHIFSGTAVTVVMFLILIDLQTTAIWNWETSELEWSLDLIMFLLIKPTSHFNRDEFARKRKDLEDWFRDTIIFEEVDHLYHLG